LGAEDSTYTRAVTRKMLSGAVARVFNPGVKFDSVLVLVGPQGHGKSEIIKRLGRSWFSDTLTTIQGKEAYEQIQGFWLIEIPELQALKKADVETIKMFTSKSEDSYRAAYDRFTCTRKRQCVFFGTTNRFEFLKDQTGNRRFWPVDIYPEKATKKIFADLTDYEVGQIWAETMQIYSKGEKLYLDTDELETLARSEQDRHLDVDPMTGDVVAYLNMKLPEKWDKWGIYERRNYLNSDFGVREEGVKTRDKVCIAEIWCEVYGYDKADLTRQKSRDISDIIMKTGEWERAKKTIKFGNNYGAQKGFLRKR
jgi:predicted P-loop ATPase